MKKDQINILKDRGIISVLGKDSKEFLQNIITNDINIVNKDNSIFSGIFTPQGKYLYEFFIVKSNDGYFLDLLGLQDPCEICAQVHLNKPPESTEFQPHILEQP